MLKPTDDTKVGCHTNTKPKILTTELSDDKNFEMIDQMNISIQIFPTGGSGFVVQKTDHLDINIIKFKPIRGSSYIAPPSALVKNHFLPNIRNNDIKRLQQYFHRRSTKSGKTNTSRRCTNLKWVILSFSCLQRMFQNLKLKTILKLMILVSTKTKFY